MPEGDTIHRIADRLAPELVGQTLERVTTQGLPRALAGRTVATVAAHGKHLVISLDDGTEIRAHLGMYGRFRRFPRAAGEAVLARTSPGRARLVLVTASGVYLWLGARVEISARRAPRHGQAIAALGPDILGDAFDSRLAASRARLHPTRMIGDVLLYQRVVAGIGNIYRSEALFVTGVDPHAPIATLPDERVAAVYSAARDLMLENRARAPFVYDRAGQPCPRCGGAISCTSFGMPARWLWWCPRCQAPGAEPGDGC